MLPLIPIAVQLAQFAPSLLRFFKAGDASTAVADQVASLAQQVSGAKTPAEALEAIKANAELQQQFNLRAMELDAQLDLAYLADRQSARARDIEFIKAGQHNTRADVMVGLAALGLIACLVVLTVFRGSIPGEVIGLISTIASLFGVCMRDAYQFEFGSSRGSREKDQLLQHRSGA
ncbi:hypothetical protein ACG04Q_12005 [Roseateles sp. DXS20W]|uniref:DUF4337 domain-containing protein n=1 Tax=Pelomonas lactea TaxID=3299030 RepID=A0ABW7GK15_9BURK